ncbi:hypothetical protein V6N13_142112 [Hibiscus sabdariffa]
MREGNGDVDTRLMKVELSIADGEGKFREVDSHLKELDGKVDELRKEMLGALNEDTKENKALKDELKMIHGELENMRQDIMLLRKNALTYDGEATSYVPIPTPSRVEVKLKIERKGAKISLLSLLLLNFQEKREL